VLRCSGYNEDGLFRRYVEFISLGLLCCARKIIYWSEKKRGWRLARARIWRLLEILGGLYEAS